MSASMNPETPPAPLAPSVEKAYYRKCIALKRRLNEVESANDQAKIRRLRLDRAIMKMRLERAFLLDELRRRMDTNVDGSEGSGEEGMATPPPDRPHRDKRRRPTSGGNNNAAGPTPQPGQAQYPAGVGPGKSGIALVPGPNGQMVAPNSIAEDGRFIYVERGPGYAEDRERRIREAQREYDEVMNPNQRGQPPAQHGSPYGPPPSGLPGSARSGRVNSMEMGAPSQSGVANGEEGRRVLSSSAESGEREHESGRNAFTAVNQ